VSSGRTRTVRITITTTAQVHAHLCKLVTLGLWGNSIAEVAEQLICEQLRKDLHRRRLAVLEQETKP